MGGARGTQNLCGIPDTHQNTRKLLQYRRTLSPVKVTLNVTKYRIYFLLLLLHCWFCIKRPRNETFWYKAAKPNLCSVTPPQAATLRARIDPELGCARAPCVKGKDTADLQRSLQLAKDLPRSSITSSGALFAWAAWLPLTKQTWLPGATPSHPRLSFPDFSGQMKPRLGQPIEGPGLPGAPALHVQLTLCFLPILYP